jgi:hypothetical protein
MPMRYWTVTFVGAIGLVGCSKPVTSMDVCGKLVQAGVAASCREKKPEGLGAAAVEAADFDLPSVAGKTGQVLRFEKAVYYQNTYDAFAAAALLAGPHRYGSEKRLIFVQMNSGASLEDGKRAKGVIDSL